MSKGQSACEDGILINCHKKFCKNPEVPDLMEEKPAILSLLPDLTNKKILDLNCGRGDYCRIFSKMGAEKVVGIDTSKKLLESAKSTNNAGNITYINLDMNDIYKLEEKYDIVFSSLEVHYISDFRQLLFNINNLLEEDGYFIFSQEHPLSTAPISGIHWTRDERMNILHYDLTDYRRDGERIISWIVNGITKYHRCFSEIVNSILEEGFVLERMLEPIPPKDLIEKLPYYEKSLHKPNYLLIKARKPRDGHISKNILK
jgi:2-polyprenyl-3-methyl-5-hydroxy-6-metoxy-1,4-benzoquinol methylase